jgi:hypothetical protein
LAGLGLAQQHQPYAQGRRAMRKWLLPSSYHAGALLAFLGLFSIGFAWLTFGLVKLAMINVDLLSKYGLMAAFDGGLLQALVLGVKGFAALLCYLGFKGIEHELVYRWLALKGR